MFLKGLQNLQEDFCDVVSILIKSQAKKFIKTLKEIILAESCF